jgi:hypothetical protein
LAERVRRALLLLALVPSLACSERPRPQAAGAGSGVARQPAGRASVRDEHLVGAPCAREAGELLDEWETDRRWAREASASEIEEIHKTPTRAPGVWLETRVSMPHRQIEALRVTAETTTVVSWQGPDCEPRLGVVDRVYNPARMREAFTDRQLARLLEGGGSGIIFAWSPHMPISLRALPQIQRAARELGLPLTVVVDPRADRALVARAAGRAGMPRDWLRPLEATELLQRGMTLHFPAMLVYSGGRITSPLNPGFERASSYATFIREHAR